MAKETNIVTVKDVIFMYTSVSYPVEQQNPDNKPMMSDDPLEGHSYEIKILISDARFKKLKKAFPGAKNFPHAKEWDKEETMEKNPYLNPDDLDDDMVLIKFACAALRGPATARVPSYPISQIGIKGKVQDMNGLTIDADTNIGNGSKGHIQFAPSEGKNGLYLYPRRICITELVEYAGGVVEEDDEGLDLEELDATDIQADAADLIEQASSVEVPEVADIDEDIDF